MKRASKLVSIVAASSILFSSLSSITFAQTTNDTVLVETKVEPKILVAPKEYSDLEIKEESFALSSGKVLGQYPVTSVTDLTQQINTDVNKVINELNSSDVDNVTMTYKADNFARYAKLTVTLNNLPDYKGFISNFYYFIDKETNKLMTSDEFEKAITVTQEPTTTAPAVELTMIPLRANAESLGWKLTWNDVTRSITLTKENKSAMITLGRETCLVNGKLVDMDKAAELQDSTMYVPSTLFDKILGETLPAVPAVEIKK